jgi:hypothetical protein
MLTPNQLVALTMIGSIPFAVLVDRGMRRIMDERHGVAGLPYLGAAAAILWSILYIGTTWGS